MSMGEPLPKPPGYRDHDLPIQRPPQFYPQKNKHKRRSCCCCCCYIIILLITFILLLVVAGAIFYFWLDPKLPVFHLQSLEFTNFNVTESPDGPTLNAQGTANVELTNPNKKLKITYGKTSVDLKSDDDLSLGAGNVRGFTQDPKNVTVVKFGIKMNELLNAENVGKVKNGLKNKTLKVSVDASTGFGIGISGWKSGIIGVRVACGALTLNQIENGASPKCTVTVLNWIHLDS